MIRGKRDVMKKEIKKICNLVIVLFIGIIVGFLLMVGVYAIPVDRMVKHSESAAKALCDMQKIDITANEEQWCGFGVDTFTDSLMISTAICDSGENIIHRAMKNQRIEYGLFNAYENLMKYYGINQKGEGKITKYEQYKGYSYARYWNGYLVVIKPLLYLFDYNIIIIMNYFFQFSLVFIIIAIMVKKKMGAYVFTFVYVMGCICITTTSRCLQFSNIVYITLISMIVLLVYGEQLEKKGLTIYLFMIIGMCVGYFDILTYPLLTLGMPLTLCLILDKYTIKESLGKVVRYSAVWVFGYGGIWSGKWILASILTNQNVIENAIKSIKYRMDSEINISCNTVIPDESFNAGREIGEWIEEFTCSDVLVRNIYGMFNYIIMSVFFVMLIIMLFLIYERRRGITMRVLCENIPFMIVAIMPFVWYIALQNHSFSHYFFTYRILSVTIFSIFCMLIKLVNDITKEIDMKK